MLQVEVNLSLNGASRPGHLRPAGARRTHAAGAQALRQHGAATARKTTQKRQSVRRTTHAQHLSADRRIRIGSSLAPLSVLYLEYLNKLACRTCATFEAAHPGTAPEASIACAPRRPTCVAPRGRAPSLRQWRRGPRSRRSPPAPPVWRRAPCPRTGWLARCRATALRYRPHCQRTCQSGGDERQVYKTRLSIDVSHSSGFQRPSWGPSTARATLRFARCSLRLARG